MGRFRLRCCFLRDRRLIRFFCRFCFLGRCFRLRRFGLLDRVLRLRGLRCGDHRRDNGRGGRGTGRVLKLGVERRVLDAVEQVQEQAVDNVEQEQNHPEQHPEIRDDPQQREHQHHRDPQQHRDHIGPEHLALIAHRLLPGDAERVGGLDVVARHEDIRHEAVFIHPDHAEHDAHDRDQRPEENPEAHPCHAADHAQEAILAECLEQVGRVRLLPSLIRVQEDHRKAHVDGPGDGEADRENAREADARKPAEQRAQQRDPPQAERPLHQRGKRFLIDRVYHRKLLHSVFSLSQL